MTANLQQNNYLLTECKMANNAQKRTT